MSLLAHGVALGWLAALCDTGSSERDRPRIVTLSFSAPPPDLEQLDVLPTTIEIQEDEHVETPSLETEIPSIDIAGTLGGGPWVDLAEDMNPVGRQGTALGELGIGLGDRGDGTGAGGRGRYERPFDRLVDTFRRDGLDVVIVFDSTSSMGPEIETVKTRVIEIGGALLRKIPRARIGFTTYKDVTDSPVASGIPLTQDLARLQDFLDDVEPAGGGTDVPEAVLAGLIWSMKGNQFRPKARKIILVFGDASPHAGDLPACLKLARRFHGRHRGKISTVTCRSPAPLPAMQAIAHVGGGEAFVLQNHQRILEELLVLIFGSRFRADVYEFFELAQGQPTAVGEPRTASPGSNRDSVPRETVY